MNVTTTQSAQEILDQSFLQVRAKLLEVAASLDRIARAEAADAVADDPRLVRIRESIDVLNSRGLNRAEQIQLIFSDAYDDAWNNE